jgi:hypothetical protein
MSEVRASAPTFIKGPFETKQEHPIVADPLQAAADDLVAVGNRLAYDVISDDLARLKKRAKALLLFTGAIAVWEIIQSKDHLKEAARQGNIIAAGMIGGGLAGGAVSFLCGPAEPICATVTVAIGANLGGMAGAAISDEWDDAVQFFKSLVWN